MFPKEIRLILIRMTIFLLPFTVGGFYSWIVQEKLIYSCDLFLFVLVMDWFFRSDIPDNQKFYFGKTATPVILMVIWGALSIVSAISIQASVFAVFFLVKAVVLHYYLVNNINNRKELKIIVFWLTGGLFFQSCLGIFQRVMGRSFGLAFLGERITSFNYGDLSRVIGTFGFPNHYGTFLVLSLWFSFGMLIFVKKFTDRLYYASAATFGIIAVIFSFSRSSWVGLAFSVLVGIIIIAKKGKLNPRLAKTLVVVILILVVVIGSFSNIIQQRIERTKGSGENRVTMIEIALTLIQKNPVIGVGLFNNEYHSFKLFPFWKPVHNTYFRLAAETGIPGLIFFLWFVWLVLKTAYKSLRIKDDFLNAVSLSVLGSYAAFLMITNFGPEYAFYRIKMLFWLIGALPFCVVRIRQREMQLIKKYLLEKQRKSDTKGVALDTNALDYS